MGSLFTSGAEQSSMVLTLKASGLFDSSTNLNISAMARIINPLLCAKIGWAFLAVEFVDELDEDVVFPVAGVAAFFGFGPSIVCVLPEPVAPYANTAAL